jgi:succinate-semialdehyde dehydrogenase / glutarate-semialdehyde dehydrogenase
MTSEDAGRAPGAPATGSAAPLPSGGVPGESTDLPTRNLIAGEAQRGGRTFAVTDPATGNVVGYAPLTSLTETREAIAAAHAAMPGWVGLGPRARGRRLEALADSLERGAERLATLLSRETGKRLLEARGELSLSVEFLRWFSAEGRRADGGIIEAPISGKALAVVSRPRGPAALLVPWNFPLSILVRKMAAALAAGCTVVARPSAPAPLTVLALTDFLLEADLPPGTVNLISGEVAATGTPLLDDHRIATVSFTGSTEVGRSIARRVSARLGHVALELGGDAPFLVYDDADVGVAVDQALVAKLRNNGQSCIAMNRLFVQRRIADRFFADLEARLRSIVIGDPLDATTTLGPVISEQAAGRLRDWVVRATTGRSIMIEGAPSPTQRPTFVGPIVVLNPRRGSDLDRREVFGPVVGARVFDSDEEGLELAARSSRGLAGYVITKDIDRVARTVANLRMGVIGINDAAPTTPEAPFGGLGDSGWGKEGGHLGLDEYLDRTFVSIRMSASTRPIDARPQ